MASQSDAANGSRGGGRGSFGKGWCYTINNYGPTTITALQALYPGACTYVIIGEEVGESGTPHIQGYIEFVKRQRIITIKKIQCLAGAHLELRRGTPKAAADYCRKDGKFTELGELSRPGSARGESLVSARADALEGASESALAENPDYIRYRRHILESVAAQKQDERRLRLREEIATSTLRPWQDTICQIALQTPDSRRVYWFYDVIGGIGKTWFSKYLVLMHGAIRFENAKSADVKHAYGGERICIFDYSRSQQEHLNYEIIESVKNGLFFSPKYDSGMRIFDIPHVIIFANFKPDLSKLSEDRWDIRDISPYPV